MKRLFLLSIVALILCGCGESESSYAASLTILKAYPDAELRQIYSQTSTQFWIRTKEGAILHIWFDGHGKMLEPTELFPANKPAVRS